MNKKDVAIIILTALVAPIIVGTILWRMLPTAKAEPKPKPPVKADFPVVDPPIMIDPRQEPEPNLEDVLKLEAAREKAGEIIAATPELQDYPKVAAELRPEETAAILAIPKDAIVTGFTEGTLRTLTGNGISAGTKIVIPTYVPKSQRSQTHHLEYYKDQWGNDRARWVPND